MRYLLVLIFIISAPALSGQTPGDFSDVQKYFDRMNKLNIKGSSSPATVLKVHDLLNNPARADVDVSYRNKLGNRVRRRTFIRMSPLKSKRFWLGCTAKGSILGCGARIAGQALVATSLNWVFNEVNGDLFAGDGKTYEPGTLCSSSKIPIEIGSPASVKWHYQVGCFVKKSNSRWEFWTNNLNPSIREWADSENAISRRADDYTTDDGVTSNYGPWWVVTRSVSYGDTPPEISEKAPVTGEEIAEQIAKNPETLIESGDIPDIWEPLSLPDAGNGDCDPEVDDCTPENPPVEVDGNDEGFVSDIDDVLDGKNQSLDTEEINIYDYFLDREGSGWLPKSCPTPTVLNLSFTTLTIDYSMMCQFASYIRTFVLFMSSILWFRIVFGAMKDA
ncbi:virulence factor TspB C-terminal domain-related protein [Shewanella sp.]|uniref:virulence factor TspB C-terminal domain-related protein n=1 Tax=Shewanella sp. TaxID=50422 RepID=UPI001D84051C|nr:virulence factor TspB C-terminal domain-related protein [Shewanella sp.]MCJ8305153.1 hypothetical protein [Shewanella sp.]NQY27813.1 hypothetical protein [Piscirickettsiaceae bacterium]NQZ33973.1 hypothetical protein [Oceanospirillaceae bacterium]